MCVLYEYDIMKSTGKLRFARGTHEPLIYLPSPPPGYEMMQEKLELLSDIQISLKQLEQGDGLSHEDAQNKVLGNIL
jgi:hypothetical protein